MPEQPFQIQDPAMLERLNKAFGKYKAVLDKHEITAEIIIPEKDSK